MSSSSPGYRRLPDLSDSDLIVGVRSGDSAALEALMGRYWTPLVRYAARLICSTDAAEDLVQQAFVDLVSGTLSQAITGSARSFLYGVVRHRAFKELRRREVRIRLAAHLARQAGRVHTPLESTIDSELRSALEQALARLPERRREAFILSRYAGLSTKEVAEVMQTSPQTAANQICAALAELRRLLRRFRP